MKTLMLLLLLAAPSLRAQTINCPSGFTTSATAGSCGVSVNDRSADFFIGNHPATPLSGSAVILAPANSGHQGNPLIYEVPVNVQAFSATFLFVGNGQNLALVIQNNQQPKATYPAWPWTFSAGAGGEGGFSQMAGGSNVAPIKTFALMLDSYSPLTEAGSFLYSSAQIYQSLQTPALPLQSGQAATGYFAQYGIDKISTTPVALNSPATQVGSPSTDTFSATVTYDGYTLTLSLFDVTAGGSCPGANCFTHTWTGVYIPEIVGASTAYVGLISGTSGLALPYAQLIKSFVFTPTTPTGTPVFAAWNAGSTSSVSSSITSAASPVYSLAPGTYASAQSVAMTTSKTPGNYICYVASSATPAMYPQPDSNGGCTTGTLYTGPIGISTTTTLYAMAGSNNSAFPLGSDDAAGIGPPSTLVAGTYTIAAAPPPPPPPLAEQATSAGAFLDSVGVNTHLAYTNSTYANFPVVLKALQTLRTKHIRDGYYPWPAGNTYYTQFQQLAAAGIKTDFVVPYNSSTSAASLEAFCGLAADCEALEYPNELDTAGGTAALGGATLQAALASMTAPMVQASTALNVPLFAPSFTQAATFTSLANSLPTSTFNNLHIYFGGRNPETRGWGSTDSQGNSYGAINWWLDNAAADGKALPVVVTETGYLAPAAAGPYGLTATSDGAYTLRTLFALWNAGVKRSYLYELIDDPSSPNYGLMFANGSGKRAFSDLSTLMWLLNDGIRPNELNENQRLAYTLSGNTANVQHTLLEKRDGTFWLALWLGVPGTDPATGASVSVPPQIVTLTLSTATLQTYWTFRAGANCYQTTPAARASGPKTYQLTVSDQVTLLRIR